MVFHEQIHVFVKYWTLSSDLQLPFWMQREKVEQLLLEPTTSHSIVCDNLRKVYPGRDGNPEKLAVRGLSLAIPRGECFGMLGPNGAGKTSFISMVSTLCSVINIIPFNHFHFSLFYTGNSKYVEERYWPNSQSCSVHLSVSSNTWRILGKGYIRGHCYSWDDDFRFN